MKTDTEDTVRVTITFNRASSPEWFNVISGIKSGRARSEIVKTHLTIPSLERFAPSRIPFEKTQPAATPEVKALQINSNQTGINSPKIFTEDNTTSSKNSETEKTITNKVAALEPAQNRRAGGGLAAHLVSGGFKSV